MKKIIKIIFTSMLAVTAILFGTVIYINNELSDNYYVSANSELNLSYDNILTCNISKKNNAVAVQSSDSEELSSYDMKVSVFGIIPVKTVHVTITKEQEVVVLGTPFGIKIYTEGVLVVGFNDVLCNNGTVNPAQNAGIKVGDTLLSINGQAINGNNDVLNAVLSSNGQMMEVVVKRNDKTFSVNITPEMSAHDSNYKLGIWIRDSSAGIGTLTFYSPYLDTTVGLGHGICDVDTGDLIPLDDGEFLNAEIVDIKKSTKETTGELQGVFSSGKIADFSKNSSTGVYGTNCSNELTGMPMTIAMKHEIEVGEAKIITTLNGEGPKAYTCEIQKIYNNDNSKIKNMVIKVTDKELLSITGGIVQGMSGSPIIQNGKLIGAVTHVLVDDPTKGYGIFAENMLQTIGEINKK